MVLVQIMEVDDLRLSYAGRIVLFTAVLIVQFFSGVPFVKDSALYYVL